MKESTGKRCRKGYAFRTLLRALISIVFIFSYSPTAHAAQVTLAWDPPATGTVNGYRVFSRLAGQSYNYSQPAWQGTSTTSVVSDLGSATHFVVRAYNSAGESGDSNEATYQPATPPPASVISRTPAALSASCTQGSNASSQSFQISNSGGGTLSYTISDDASWLWCSPTSGTSTGASNTVALSYTTSGLATGTHSATITITASSATNSPQTIPVSLTVNASPPALSRSPASLSASCVQGANAPTQSFQVANSGGGTLSYTVSANAGWVSCSPTGGTCTGATSAVAVNYATSGLAAGTYSAAITIAASGASNSPQTIPVSLTVNAPPPAAVISRTPPALSASCVRGSNASSQSFQVSNSGGGTLGYTISANAGWLSCSPTGGTSTGASNTVTVSYATSGLAAGTHSATIAIAASGASNSPQTIPVTLTVVETLPLEVGEVSVDYNWKPIAFKKSFIDPVIVATILTTNDSAPAVARIRNLTGTGCEIRIQAWNYLDGAHSTETVGYVVVERGRYTLADGTQVEAGRFMTNKTSSYAAIGFSQPFRKVPVMAAAVTTVNEADTVTGRLRKINTQRFEFRLQEQELNAQKHLSETICYLAWEPSSGTVNGMLFEVGRTQNSVTDAYQTIKFLQGYRGEPPVVVADMQTTDGSDTANVRCANRDLSGIDVQIDEEQSRNKETVHTTEVVGYMIFDTTESQ